MGMISVLVQDERGIAIGERVDLPTDLFPKADDMRFVCLRFVDPYGDTFFNRLQVQAVLVDLQLLKTTKNKEQLELIHRLETLVRACEKEPHLYLRFIGD